MAEDESFKITDRRRGRDVDEPPERPVPTPEGSPPPAPPSPGGASAPFGEVGHGAPDLSSLFVMFASSALVNLGEAPDPASGERRVDLDQARDAIDLLLLLREKTRGNLTGEESRLLEDVLYDLQLRFVRVTNRR